MLGEVAVRSGEGAPAPVTGHAGRLLAVLAGAHPEARSRDALVEALWAGAAPASAASAFRVHLARLRRALADVGAAVERRGSGYALVAPTEALDLALAARLADRARRRLVDEDDPAGAAADAGRARSLFRGPPFDPFGDEPALAGAQEQARRLLRSVEELEVDAGLAAGDHERLLGRLETLVVTEPLCEHRWAQLMLALYRSGRQADALEAYQRARRTLVDQVGAEPGPELQHLERAVLTHAPELALGPVPHRRSVRPHDAPVVGRSAVLDELEQLVAGAPVVTVAGPTGSGTSTVVRAFARDRTGPGGAPVLDRGSLVNAGGADPPAPDPVHGEPLLAVDLDAAPDPATLDALRALVGRGRRVLVAAHAPLGLAGERVLDLPPLTLDDATELLVATLGRDEPTAALAAVADAVGGHPLSLHLAAGWVRTLGEATVASSLADGRLSLVADGEAALVAQVARIRDVLDPAAATALPLLASFRHDVDADAVAALAGTDLGGAAAILGAWRRAGIATAAGEGRWRFPAAVRDAAWHLAGEAGVADAAAAARRAFLVGVVAPWGLASYGLDGPGCVAAVGPWAPELVRLGEAALEEGDLDLVARLSEGRYWYWDAAGAIAEGDAWFRRVVEVVDAAPDHPATPCLLTLTATFGPTIARMAARADLARRAHDLATGSGDEPARALSGLAVAAGHLWAGDVAAAEGVLAELAEHPGDPWPVVPVMARVHRGAVALLVGDTDRATAELTMAHHRSRALGSALGEQVALLFLAHAARAAGDAGHALACYRAAVATAERCAVGHRPDHARIGEAELLVAAGDDEGARDAYEQAIAGRLEAHDDPAAADCLCGLAEIAARRARPAEAAAGFRHALLLAWRARDREPLVRAVVGLAGLAADRGDALEAARVLGALEPSVPAGGRPPSRLALARRDELRDRLGATHGDAARAALAEGSAAGVEALVARSGVLAAVETP